MPRIGSKHLNVHTSEDHIIRRLGKAVVWQWDELPVEVQRRIVDQATSIMDMHDLGSDRVREQIKAFIDKRKGTKDPL
jgi:hypothetical protein